MKPNRKNVKQDVELLKKLPAPGSKMENKNNMFNRIIRRRNLKIR